MDACAVEARKNVSLVHLGFASLGAEVKMGEPVVGGDMKPVLLSVYAGAGLIEVSNGAPDDLILDLGHNPVKFTCESDNRALDGTGRQRYPKHAAEYLFDAVGADCAYGVEGNNQAPKLFAVLNRPLDVFRERAAQSFPGKRTGDGERFMGGDMDVYGGIRYFTDLRNACLASAFLI